ncbi:MAG: TetR/AcrR family transcriptional regulator [Roseibium sp.]
MSDTKLSHQILSCAREILASDGLSAVSFDAIARRLGCSKQAVLYWYPTKHDLLAAMVLPWLEAEVETAVGAVSVSKNRTHAVGSFIRSVVDFHVRDLERFRMMYLVPQTTSAKSGNRGQVFAGEKIYPVTSRLYGALADHLDGDSNAARKEAVAIHSAVLGLVLMFALSDAIHDPMKHSHNDLRDALIASFTQR